MERNDLDNPAADWWAKLDHARRHLAHLSALCAEFRNTRPFEVRAESTADGIAYRFIEHRPIPLEISLVLGDVVHSLRSSLDSLVFGIVSRERNGNMNEREERACQFPICANPKEFDKFISGDPVRNAMMPARLRDALRTVQPFFWVERAKHEAQSPRSSGTSPTRRTRPPAPSG